MDFMKKCKALAQKIGEQTYQAHYESAKKTYFDNPEYFMESHGKSPAEMLEFWQQNIGSGIKSVVVPGKKYTKIDVCTPQRSGRYMVVNDTGEIFGIKSYGVIHKGHKYGTLDTIEQYYWGDYTAIKLQEVM
jgi:hypothetical protein